MAEVLTVEPQRFNQQIVKVNELFNAGELDQAYAIIQDVLAYEPDDPQALVVAAVILKKAGKTPVGYSLAKRAAELAPHRPETWNALAHCAQQLWKLDEAQSCYRKALQRAQTAEQRALYLNNLASTLIDGGQFAKAEGYARQSLELRPDDGMARHNLGLCLLAQRRWREAWPYYSASVGTTNRPNTKYTPQGEPEWDGSPGKTVVVYGEQGLGDEICFASMYPDAVRNAGRIIIDCDKRLTGLFKRSFPGATVHGTRYQKDGLAWPEADRRVDASISAGELGKLYRNADEDFSGAPYLVPCPVRTEGWRAYFKTVGKPVIGIAWSGGTWSNGAMNRLLPLKDWRPIFDAVDAHWVSLQYRDAAADIAGTPVVQYPWATLTKDYDDTAALVAACDVVVCMQTAIAHLAGALGVPCHVMVPRNSQWRYGEGYTDIPWYRSVRVYRNGGTEWGGIVRDIARALRV